ncbi:hypothetical protein ACFOSS_01340 [Pseudaeromonas sharmana]|uniref:Lipoprotein n=1 Tax=Pseudaeromonas sharmana TaxID=328412 RepID=A0ABV8CIS9_9GAMM
MKKQFAVMLALGLSGCGGGGSGDVTTQPAQPLLEQYGGSRQAMTLSYDETPRYLQLALQQPGSDMAVMSAMTQSATGAALTRQNVSRMGSARDNVFACDAGQGSIGGNLNDSSGKGTLTFDFEHCLLDGIEFHGRQTVSISRWDSVLDEPMDYVITNALQQTSEQGVSRQVRGTVSVTNAGQCDQRIVTDILYKAEQAEDDIYLDHIDNYRTCNYSRLNYNQSFSGNIYLGKEGYLEILSNTLGDDYSNSYFTMTDTQWNNESYQVPDHGVINFFGRDSYISLRFVDLFNDYANTPTLSVDIRAAVDGSYKRAYVPRAYLQDPRIRSLRDSDADGMWDDWETLVGLDPALDDAAQDADRDGSTNLHEFLGAGLPLDSHGVPPAMSYQLWLSSSFVVGQTTMSTLTWSGDTDILALNDVKADIVFDISQLPALTMSAPFCQLENNQQQLRCTVSPSSIDETNFIIGRVDLGELAVTPGTAGELDIPYYWDSPAFLPLVSTLKISVQSP